LSYLAGSRRMVRCTVVGHEGNRVDGWWMESCCSGRDFGQGYGRDHPTQRFDVSAAQVQCQDREVVAIVWAQIPGER
jgi:hypothetical protein